MTEKRVIGLGKDGEVVPLEQAIEVREVVYDEETGQVISEVVSVKVGEQPVTRPIVTP